MELKAQLSSVQSVLQPTAAARQRTTGTERGGQEVLDELLQTRENDLWADGDSGRFEEVVV